MKLSEAMQNRRTRQYLRYVESGRCVTCGKSDERTRSGRVRCSKCAGKCAVLDRKRTSLPPEKQKAVNAENRALYAMRKKLGLCVNCGKRDRNTTGGKRFCVACSVRDRKWRRDHYDAQKDKAKRAARVEKWRAAGLCTNCGRERQEPDRMWCVDCRVRARMQCRRRKMSRGGD